MSNFVAPEVQDEEEIEDETKVAFRKDIKKFLNNYSLHLPHNPWAFSMVKKITLYNIWNSIVFLVEFILGLFFNSARDKAMAWHSFVEGKIE